MTRAEFTAELERLRKTVANKSQNPLCYNCTGCEGCLGCTFCQRCQDCFRCTHCEGCSNCTNSSHCQDCSSCHECSQCQRSQACRGSAYLIECWLCTDCTYCYGCVGLSKKEFHILNVPYERKEYFRIVKSLERSRRPPVVSDEPVLDSSVVGARVPIPREAKPR